MRDHQAIYIVPRRHMEEQHVRDMFRSGWLEVHLHAGDKDHSVVTGEFRDDESMKRFMALEGVHHLPDVLDSEATVNDHHVKHLGHIGVTKTDNALKVRLKIRKHLHVKF